jgi:hypothetical protein
MAMGKYAKDTKVPVYCSKSELEKTLIRYGATGFFSAWQDDPPVHQIGFKIMDGENERLVKIQLPLPAKDDPDFTITQYGHEREPHIAHQRWEKACRQKWRALNLVVKAKLEAIDSGISTVEREFLADVMLPDGTTVGDWARPQLEAAYNSGKMPALLPGMSKKRKR